MTAVQHVKRTTTFVLDIRKSNNYSGKFFTALKDEPKNVVKLFFQDEHRKNFLQSETSFLQCCSNEGPKHLCCSKINTLCRNGW